MRELEAGRTASVFAKCNGCMHCMNSSLFSVLSAHRHCSELLLPSSQELRKKEVKFWDVSLSLEEGRSLYSREIGCRVLWGLPLCSWCPSFYVVQKRYLLCITRQKRATILYSSPPLSLPALLDLHMCCSKGPLHPLFERDAVVMRRILSTEDVIGELPLDLEQLQKYRTFHLP